MRGLNYVQHPHGGSPASLALPNAEAALPHAATVVRNKNLEADIIVGAKGKEMNEEPELQGELRKGFAEVINRYSGENEANVPDFILADYLVRCFNVFNHGVQSRDKWYSVHLEPCNSHFIKAEDAPKNNVE